MTISIYSASVPAFQQLLGSLRAILDKGAEHCRAAGISEARVLDARLAPDMFPLVRQVQIATDHAKGAVARLAAREIPKYEDREATFEELKARVDKTLAFIGKVPAAALDGGEDREITLTLGGQARTMSGGRYLFHFALPNFYFHVATAYDILRHNGVELGKRDYLGTPPQE